MIAANAGGAGMTDQVAAVRVNANLAIIETLMKAIELVGDIDEQHRLQAHVPADLPAWPVRLIVLLPDEDEADLDWSHGVTKEWVDNLQDPGQDLYTLEDGQPVNVPR